LQRTLRHNHPPLAHIEDNPVFLSPFLRGTDPVFLIAVRTCRTRWSAGGHEAFRYLVQGFAEHRLSFVPDLVSLDCDHAPQTDEWTVCRGGLPHRFFLGPGLWWGKPCAIRGQIVFQGMAAGLICRSRYAWRNARERNPVRAGGVFACSETLQSDHAMVRLQGDLLICANRGNLRINSRMG